MLQVYKYITFSESQLISEVIENVSFVAWLVKFLVFHDDFACFTLTFCHI